MYLPCVLVCIWLFCMYVHVMNCSIVGRAYIMLSAEEEKWREGSKAVQPPRKHFEWPKIINDNNNNNTTLINRHKLFYSIKLVEKRWSLSAQHLFSLFTLDLIQPWSDVLVALKLPIDVQLFNHNKYNIEGRMSHELRKLPDASPTALPSTRERHRDVYSRHCSTPSIPQTVCPPMALIPS